MQDQIDMSEAKARKRAYLMLFMSAALVINAIMIFANHSISPATQNSAWFILVALTALNLTSYPAHFRKSRLGALLNDETTRLFRLKSLAMGFWISIIATLAILFVTVFVPLNGVDVARIIVTAGLAGALVNFSILELKACC